MDSLGYGTQLILDGFNAEPQFLQDASVVTACLNEVAALLESTPGDVLTIDDVAGMSATLRLSESQISLHTYSANLSLQLFSRHDVRLSEVSDVLVKHFSVRRIESFLSSHAKTLPQDPEARKKVLVGDRAYSALRLEAA